MWFAFAVPERSLSAQVYVFARQNLGVVAAGAFCWDRLDEAFPSAAYSKMFWHLPFPTTPLSDVELSNGLRIRAAEAQRVFDIRYDDPDGDALHIAVRYEAIAAPHYLHTHLDQPGRFTGTITLDGEAIAVDGWGFRDRSWGVRTQFGEGVVGPAEYAAYTYGTASAGDGFFTLSADFGGGPSGETTANVHGYLLRDGDIAPLREATRTVLERSPAGHPARVLVEGADAEGRTFTATGTARNSLSMILNPNLFTINGLFDWRLDGLDGYGEDHDNWSAAGYRRFAARSRRTTGGS